MVKGSDFGRVEIIVRGLVQGVGFRYFVLRNAQQLGLTGYVKNLFTGEVLTVAEGPAYKLEELIELLKVGPVHADVRDLKVERGKATGEFTGFEVRY